jgi:hypothetical protein
MDMGLVHGPYSGMFLPGGDHSLVGTVIVVNDEDGPAALYEVIRDPVTDCVLAIYVGAPHEDMEAMTDEIETTSGDQLADEIEGFLAHA